MNAFDSKLLDGKTKLHFVGIGGSGMFPLVQILHEVGYEITGSDVNEGDIIDRERKLGIPISMGHKAENVHGAELVVYTAAIMKGNPEIEEAHRLGIPTVERSILLGYVANTYPHPICIAGTHGKTTTTAMTTQIMVMAHADPGAVIGGKLPFIMQPEGLGALYGPGLAEGPFPEHYEPMESPFKKNIMSAQRVNPALHSFGKDMNPIANASPDFPLVMTTYSCTEHWCTGAFTRWQPWLVEAQPQAYVEISEELAKEKGIANGEKVRISSARGTVDAVAMVTVRLTPFKCGGKTVHQVGMTFNYGWLQPKECGDTANLLSPMVGDANSMTPEYKAFMVNIDKIKA